MPPTAVPPRRRVKYKQRAPRSARGSGRRTTRTLVAALLAVGFGAPAALFLRAVVREGLADPARVARRFQVGAPTEDEALLRLPAAPPVRTATATNNQPRAAAAGWSTPAPETATPGAARPWEAPFAGGSRTVAVTVPVAPAPILAARGPAATVAAPAPFPAPIRGASAIPVSPRSLDVPSLASLATAATGTAIERAPTTALLAPTTGAAAVAPGPRSRVAAAQPAAGPLPFVWSGAAVAVPSLGNNSNWTNSSNWAGNAAPGPTASENIVYAAAPVAATATTVNTNYTINSLTFQAGAPSYNITNLETPTLTVGAGGVADASGSAQTLNLPVILGAAQTWNVSNAAGVLDVENAVTGSGGLTKTGAGTLTFGGSANVNNFGPTSVTGGTLLLNKNSGVLALSGDLSVGNAVNPGAAGSVVTRLLNPGQTGSGTNLTVFGDGLFDLTRSFGEGGTTSVNTTIGNLTMTGGEVRIGAGVLGLTGNVVTNASATSARITSTDFNSDVTLGNADHSFNVARGTATYDLDVPAGISSGSLTKTGAGVLRLAGVYNSGFFVTLNAGTIAVADDNALGYNGGGEGDIRAGIRPGAYDPGLNYTTLTLAGGTLTADGGDRVIGNPVNLTANATIGASLDASPRALSFANALTVANSSTLTVNNTAATVFSGPVFLPNGGTFTVAGTGTTTISGQIADAQPDGTPFPGALAKSGSGTLILSHNNTYTGGTTVSGGTLLANNSPGGLTDSPTGRGTVLILDGARLGGTGSIGGRNVASSPGGTGNAVTVAYGDVVIGGTAPVPGTLPSAIAPINHAVLGAGATGASSTGILTVNGNLTLTATALLEVEVAGTTAGTGYDQVRVGGAIALGGDLSLATLNGFALTLGQTFYILDGIGVDAVTGVFANVTPETATTGLFTDANGERIRVNYADSDPNDPGQTTGNDVSLTVLNVPEPGSLALVTASATALGICAGGFRPWLRRRRHPPQAV